ncbi:hypothetical protein NIES37_54640 [Tolypothrix tenuis PCC 7101]|uniref:Uncharacterized protein n=1 Tax=Tolypothrix tenuis PCC 7101 TaxID=231146 RepID=A0A1Z4N6X9_9CYAN|nr:hypothetical protein NIES37_54640 [Tolypothrix tenuis PCC 7101]BAZ74613.1 hypothetical protein NIES50_31910 [Aulosira laxa NIES-50]
MKRDYSRLNQQGGKRKCSRSILENLFSGSSQLDKKIPRPKWSRDFQT